MAAAFLDTIGLISGALGIIQFGMDNFKSGASAEGATVQIAPGLQESSSQSMGGKVKAVHGFDIFDNYLGVSKTDFKCPDGEPTSVTISQGNNKAATYVDIINTDDAICYAYVAVTQPLGGQFALLGDIGRYCGQHYYDSNIDVGTTQDGNAYYPSCMWMDGDGTNGIPSASFKFRVDTFTTDTSAIDPDTDKYCGNITFSTSTNPITKRKRSVNLSSKLVVSSISQHNATDLCANEMSHGPDMVDSHGYYCDMDTKTVHPLCSVAQTDDCVDFDESSGALNKRSLDEFGVQSIHKRSFDKIINW
ncbi:hypothetical protein K490DRAFT_64592 [Saccharata proteae CBS 121410]|uniref:Uncharacterized protein n=1 Tax=Saccharata proteae CBS 121410 TaxID=1314787 RepID=A0A9P4M150_9PEZI|nr:hypothetical protein K490DRAFT_64592 [Saccharata proteae CBS 121410]